MSLFNILIICLVLVAVGVFPSWGYSSGYGYGPSGGIITVLVIIVILKLLRVF